VSDQVGTGATAAIALDRDLARPGIMVLPGL
jgi:hypothetical protein